MNGDRLPHPTAEMLAAFKRGQLSQSASAEVAAHVAQCQSCSQAVQAVPTDDVPPTLPFQGQAPADSVAGQGARRGPDRGPLPPNISEAPSEPLAALQKVVEPFGYRLVRRIGGGGMGEVYRAEHKLLKRPCAIKVIRQHLLQHPKAIDRFLLEIEATAKLSHHNIVAVYDAQRAGDTLFLVMEYIRGESLDKVVARRGPLSVNTACTCVQQAALGLQHAHEHKMVHRDIKPSNLLLSTEGRLKVSDFGLVHVSREESALSELTGSGEIVGTWDYIAPEQIQNSSTADPRADIYSLGCTLYHLLAGQPPFPGGSLAQKIAAHLYQTPTPLATLRSDLPEGLIQVIDSMMSKARDDRYPTSLEVVKALGPFGKPVSVPRKPPPPGEKPERPRAAPPQLVTIPAGEAVLGAKKEVIAHLVATYGLAGERLEQFASPPSRKTSLPPFAIARCAVSNDEYRAFVEATGWRKPSHWQAQNSSTPSASGDRPVVNVSFFDAEAFCQWKGVRLPTNDEWERAARGSHGWAYPWGDVWRSGDGDAGLPCHTLERHRATGVELVSVSDLPASASPEGLLNMVGNVWEWVDGGAGEKKHTRGCSWRYQGDVYGLSWFRLPTDPDILDNDVGFRYARDAGPSPQKHPALSADDLAGTVAVPAGNYQIGVTPEQLVHLAHTLKLGESDVQKLGRNPVRTVPLKSFAIRRYCVTNEEYFQFAKETGYPWPEHWSRDLLRWFDRPFLEKYRHHPVTNVSFKDATAFCAWRGGRLPTNEEWEYTARGDACFVYPWGNEFDPRRCNGTEAGLARTTRVDEHPNGVSPAGCYDMAGNVHEWIAPDAEGRHFVRGGSFRYQGLLYGLTFLYIPADPDVTRSDIGFRYLLK